MKIGMIAFLLFALIQLGPAANVKAADTASPLPSQNVAANTVYKLRVKNHWMANKTIKDLVDLLGGRSKSNLLKGSRPQTIRMQLSVPKQQSAYFLSKLSSLGQLTSPAMVSTGADQAKSDPLYRMSLDIFDP
jgi:hypothetical protein